MWLELLMLTVKDDLDLQIRSESRDSYFLVSSPDIAGSPPCRMPPSPVNMDKSSDIGPDMSCNIGSSNTYSSRDNYIFKEETPDIKPVKPIRIIPLGLPPLRTGI